MGIEKNYDGYGYSANEAFVTIAKQKGLEYPAVKNAVEGTTEIESFISNEGQPVNDLVQPKLFDTFK